MTPTQLFIILVFLGFIAADVILVALHQPTESQTIQQWSQRYTSVPYIIGMIVGHWILNSRTVIMNAWGYAFLPCLLLIAFDVIWNVLDRQRVWFRFGAIYLLLGLAAGSLFWSQGDGASLLPW